MLRSTSFSVCAGLLSGFLLVSIASADVYKYTDEKGNVQYTDRPLKLPAQRLNIQSQRTDVVEMNQRADTDAKADADREKARQSADKSKSDKKNSQAANTESKAEACTKARQNYLDRMNAQRLYEEQPNGERRYLTDAELESSRNTAKSAMDAMCN